VFEEAAMKDPAKGKKPDNSDQWLNSLEHLLQLLVESEGPTRAQYLFYRVLEDIQKEGIVAKPVSSPYLNTISAEEQPDYPGDREMERRIKSLIRWNAMAMVVKANREHHGLGGHISTFASSATLYEVGFNHFFHAGNHTRYGDMIYFQGHGAPGM
jgi:pyruvate dehydrogenase E1 component